MTDRMIYEFKDGRYPGIHSGSALSPDRRSIVFSEAHRSESGSVVDRLRVLPRDGQETDVVDEDTYDFAWSPDSKRIAYTKQIQVAEFETKDLGTWLYDIGSRQKTKLLPRGGTVFWAGFDNMIYGFNPDDEGYGTVYRVDPSTGKEQETDYPSNNFSPDGRYIMVWRENALHITLRKTGEEWLANPACKVAPWQRHFLGNRWLDSRTLATFQRPWASRHGVPRASYLLNIETGDIRQSPHYFLGLIDNSTRVVEIIREGEFQIRKVSDLEVFTEEEAKKMENATAEKPYVPPVK